MAWLLAVVADAFSLGHWAILGVMTSFTAVVALHASTLVAVSCHVASAATVLSSG